MPTEIAREKLLHFLHRSDSPLLKPKFMWRRGTHDRSRTRRCFAFVENRCPKHVFISVGGGVQDKLGLYLMEKLDFRPAIHCIGAALGFQTGDQVRIPDWIDRFYLGWFLRSLAQPRVIIPRFWSARKLP